MKKSLFLFLIMTVCWPIAAGTNNESLESVLRELDRTVISKREYELEKQLHIAEINSAAPVPLNNSRRYDLYQQLYEQYGSYNIDSAMYYALNKARIAEMMGDRNRQTASQMDLAGVYTNAGMYAEAVEILQQFGNEARRQDIIFYYHICHSLSAGMYQNSEGSSLSRFYHTQLDCYRDSLLSVLGKDDISYCFVKSEKLIDHGYYLDAIEILNQWYNDPRTNDRNRAILDYSLAVAALGDGDTEAAKLHYAKSAITDLRTPVKEYKSLQELALLLYREGDVSRAYNYIMCSMEDVLASNTRLRSQAVTPILPIITQAYERVTAEQKRQITGALILVAVLFLFAVVLLVVVARQNRNIRESAAKLRRANDDLKIANAKLTQTTEQLFESNCIKDEYVTRYMELSSEYIDNLEKYRRSLLKVARTKSVGELIGEIEVPLQLDDILREFYTNFDQTFVHICPTFVDEVNSLLREEERLIPKQGRLLNTELRLLALIRLGVTDSVKIAHFLRCSLSTVYNYKTKLRNAAIDSRDDLEAKVATIGLIKMD